jgi:hypothetical protein
MGTLWWLKTTRKTLLVVGLCLIGFGCGPTSGRAKVKGKVKFFDKYLTAGTVTFTAKDGRTGSGNIDFDGNYEVGDAPVGDCVITVKVPTLPQFAAAGKDKMPSSAKRPSGLPEMKAPGAADDTNFTPNTIDPSRIVQIPGKYGSVDTSGLTYTVGRGEQTKDITLTP